MNPRTLLYWLIVAIPLTCGVLFSVNTALPLFGVKPVVIPYLTAPAAASAPKPAADAATPPPLAAPDANATPVR